MTYQDAENAIASWRGGMMRSRACWPIYWQLQTAEIIAWTSIEDGTVIYKGGIVSYGGKTWICIEQHIKSAVFKPKSGSSKWAEYDA